MGQAGENWDKTKGEVRQIRLSGLANKIEADSKVAVPDVPQQVQTGPDRVVSV